MTELWRLGAGDPCKRRPDYGTIQDAVDNATAGETIYVCPATNPYEENVVIDKPLTIESANAGTPGNGTRKAEVVVVPGSRDLATGRVFSIQASGVTIDGLTIDGNNDAVQGVSIDASSTVYDNITVSNNIFQNFPNSSTLGPAVPAGGIIAQASASAASTGNVFAANLLRNFEGYVDSTPEQASIGIGVANNFGASITDNVITNVAFGILMFGIDPSVATATVTGGDISNVRRGIVIYPGPQPGGTPLTALPSPRRRSSGSCPSGSTASPSASPSSATDRSQSRRRFRTSPSPKPSRRPAQGTRQASQPMRSTRAAGSTPRPSPIARSGTTSSGA